MRELTQEYIHNLRDRLLASGLPKHIVDDAIVRARAHAGGKAAHKKKPDGTEDETQTEGESNERVDGGGIGSGGGAEGGNDNRGAESSGGAGGDAGD